MGEDHKIYNNYIEGTRSRYPNTNLSNGLWGINITNGRTDGVVNGYYPVKNATIVNNTFVNCDYGIRVGTKFDTSQSVAPDDVIIGNNIIFLNSTISNASSNRAIQVTTALTGTLSKYEGNIKQNGIWDITTTSASVAPYNSSVSSGLLALNSGLYRITSGSTAIDTGKGTYSFLSNNIFAGTRPASFDVGTEEFGTQGARLPYNQSNVGLSVGFYGTEIPLSVNNYSKIENTLQIYPIPLRGDYLNLSLEKQELGNIQIIDMLGKSMINA